MPTTDQIWMVRAGRRSAYVDLFRDEGRIAIGFGEVPEFPLEIDRDELKRQYAEEHPRAPAGKVANAVGQVLRFVQELGEGDRVATYDAERREYLLGRITSGPQRIEDDEAFSWYREVEWKRHVSRDVLTTPTRNSLGSSLTLFQIRDDAAREVSQKSVPLDTPLSEAEDVLPVTDGDEGESSEEDIVAKAEDFIEDRLVRLDWQELQELVAGLLRAMGYQTEISDPGPDRGVDIFASPDGLGLEEPRIFVEVKHRPTTTMGGPEIRSFLGGRQPGDRCLYVSTGGFSKDARYEADRANVPIKLVTLSKLRELLLQYYEELDPDIKTLVPLRRIYWPAD